MKPVSQFNRAFMTGKLRSSGSSDIIIIGGGATGLGIAVDAASRGFKTVLLEQSDFAKGTSSRSTKLVHGGVRYLAQGNIKLVYKALKERGLLLKNAPHLVKRQNFIIPCYSQASKFKYLVGLKIYDWLSKSLSFGSSKSLNKDAVLAEFPHLKSQGLVGGIQYFDGQFDDARLAINLAQTAAEEGGVLLNYCRVEGLLKSGESVSGVIARDLETQAEYRLQAKVVINATGVFVDDILKLDKTESAQMVSPSQGVHVVLDKSALESTSALMIPETPDGRVLFAIPWYDHLLIGTTDTPISRHSLEPRAQQQEISFILETVGQYLKPAPTLDDVLTVFAGLRPLAAAKGDTSGAGKKARSTKEISRDHKLVVSESGLITITGGKWTTYREMAEATVNQAISTGNLNQAACKTAERKIHGYSTVPHEDGLSPYGADASGIESLLNERPEWKRRIAPNFSHTVAEVVWAVRNEMARTVEDILARRLRILFLDARTALAAAPAVAEIIATELGCSESWREQQIKDFSNLASQYLPAS